MNWCPNWVQWEELGIHEPMKVCNFDSGVWVALIDVHRLLPSYTAYALVIHFVELTLFVRLRPRTRDIFQSESKCVPPSRLVLPFVEYL